MHFFQSSPYATSSFSAVDTRSVCLGLCLVSSMSSASLKYVSKDQIISLRPGVAWSSHEAVRELWLCNPFLSPHYSLRNVPPSWRSGYPDASYPWRELIFPKYPLSSVRRPCSSMLLWSLATFVRSNSLFVIRLLAQRFNSAGLRFLKSAIGRLWSWFPVSGHETRLGSRTAVAYFEVLLTYLKYPFARCLLS